MKINEYEIKPNKIATLFAPYKYQSAQKKVGCEVITSTKQAWYILYNRQLEALIIYTDPDDNVFIRNVCKYALNNNIKIFYRANCIPGMLPSYEEITKERPVFYNEQYVTSQFDTAVPVEVTPLDDRTKNKLLQFIKYYDLDYPVNETEWHMIHETVKYYSDNKIEFSFDENTHYICEECGELVARGTKHTCYYDEPIKRTKVDYLVNGGE